MIETHLFISVDSIIETMKRHISLMYKFGLYAEAMQTECALATFIDEVKRYNLDLVYYETAKKKLEGWERDNDGK